MSIHIISAFGIGAIMIGMAIFSSNVTNLAQVNSILTGVITGPTSSVFLLGMLNPWCTSKGAWIGYLSSYVRKSSHQEIILIS